MKNVIFDVDGTIADCNHRRHFVDGSGPVDWDSFRAETVNDTPIDWVCSLAQKHVQSGDNVMFVSARNNSERGVTKFQIREWIGIDNPVLFMRPDGDYRPDDEFKRDTLQVIRGVINGDPDLVYDDRNRVVDMWRNEGIEVVQVVNRVEGNF